MADQTEHISDEKVPETAAVWIREGAAVAVATVAQTWGSAPRPAGSQLAIREDGTFVGSVSGGCVEAAVIHEGLDAISSGKARLVEYGVSNTQAWDVGLACGGKISIYVKPVQDGHEVTRLAELRAIKTPCVEITNLHTDETSIIELSTGELPTELVKTVTEMIESDRSGIVEAGTQSFLINTHNPPLRLVIIGAVHIAQALTEIATTAGYNITVIDPREAFANAQRFRDIEISLDWPDEALKVLQPDARTAIVTLTHDPKIDDPALHAALNSKAFYIGSLGSNKTHNARLERLRRAGFSEEQLERIHGPVGLDIGSKSPAEIAVSILAEITSVLRLGKGR